MAIPNVIDVFQMAKNHARDVTDMVQLKKIEARTKALVNLPEPPENESANGRRDEHIANQVNAVAHEGALKIFLLAHEKTQQDLRERGMSNTAGFFPAQTVQNVDLLRAQCAKGWEKTPKALVRACKDLREAEVLNTALTSLIKPYILEQELMAENKKSNLPRLRTLDVHNVKGHPALVMDKKFAEHIRPLIKSIFGVDDLSGGKGGRGAK